jgi:hypothetical protein
MNVKSLNNISKWQMEFNPAFKGLMELFTATEKLEKFFWGCGLGGRLEVFDCCTTDDTAHIDTIFKFLPHTENWPEHVQRHLQRSMGDHFISACTDTQF